MRNLLSAFLCLISITSFGQTPKLEFDGKKWNPPYTLNTPEGWGVEHFLIPIEFAPSIPYKGVEDIRFTPGWGNAKTDECWTYCFLCIFRRHSKNRCKDCGI